MSGTCLAIDTAADVASVAVRRDGVLASSASLGSRRAARQLAPVIGACLNQADLTLDDIDRVAITDGPGSFTGIRIGYATLQGLLQGRDLPVCTAPSLMAWARAAMTVEGRPVVAMYDALRGEVFAAVYLFGARDVTVLQPPTLTTVDALRETLPEPPVAVAGDDAVLTNPLVAEWLGAPALASTPGGAAAALALHLEPMGACDPIPALEAFEPTYGRPAEAQARWEREHGRPLSDATG